MIAIFRAKKREIASAEERRKSWAVSGLCAACIMVPCLAYAVLGDAPLVPVLAGIALLGSLIKRVGLPVNGRTVIYTVVASGIVTVILNQVYKVDPERFFMPLPAEIAVPFFLGLAIGACYLVQTTRTLTLVVLMSVLAMLEMGTSLNDPTDNQRLVVKGTIWAHRHVTYGVAAMVQVLVMLPLLQAALPRRVRFAPGTRAGRSRGIAYALCVVVLTGVTALFCVTLPGALQEMDRVMTPMLNAYFRHARTPRAFGDNVDLNQTLGLKDQVNANKIVLRVKSPAPPQYLRGRVYTTYQGGRWSASSELAALPTREVDEALSVRRFVRDPAAMTGPLPAVAMEVLVTDRYHSDVLHAPGNAQVIEAIASRLMMEPDGALKAPEWDSQGGYTVFVPEVEPFEPWQGDHQPLMDTYLQVPPELAPELAAQATRIFGEAEVSDARQLAFIQSWFPNHFDYELGVELVPEKDPVLCFLEDLQSGHCELFAAATTLLLRSRGIPARYVTGFVAMEEHPNQNYWVARLGDSHAWVEAYDRQQERWVLVEPTPASGVPGGEDRMGLVDQLRERLAVHWEAVFALIKRGYFAEAIMGVLVAVWATLVWAFWSGPWYVSWPLVLVLVWQLWGGAWRSLLRARRERQSQPAALVELGLWRQRLEAQLQRYGVFRDSTQTVRDLIERVHASDQSGATAAVPLLEEYESLRFRPEVPSLETVQAFGRRVETWLRGHATRSGTSS